MTPKQLSPQLSVSPQLSADDIATVKEAGFRAIICNRPDGEEAGQPGFAAIEAAAAAAGIEARYIPVEPGMVTEDAIRTFGAAIRDLPKPILAYCRSGARSSTLWSVQDALKAS